MKDFQDCRDCESGLPFGRLRVKRILQGFKDNILFYKVFIIL